MQCKDELDWVAKLALLESYRDRDGLDWDHPKLALVDLQYADVRPDKGLYHRLVRLGRMERLVDDSEVEAAVTHPPGDTRAYFRGRCLAKYPEQVAAASWDSVIFDLPGPRLAAAGADPGAAARHAGARRRACSTVATPPSSCSRRSPGADSTGSRAPRRLGSASRTERGWVGAMAREGGQQHRTTKKGDESEDAPEVEPSDRRRRAQGAPRRGRRRDPRRDRRRARGERRGLRPQLRAEGWPVSPTDSGRLPGSYLVPGSSSFADFVAGTPLTCCRRGVRRRRGPGSRRRTAPRSSRPRSTAAWSWPATAGPRWATSSPSATSRRSTRPTSTPASASPAAPASRSRWCGCSRPSSSTTRRSRASRCPSTARPTGSPP